MRYQVEITPQAEEDLAEIVSYIAKDDPLMAEAFGVELVDQALTLSTLPYRGSRMRGTRSPANWFMASTLSSMRSTNRGVTLLCSVFCTAHESNKTDRGPNAARSPCSFLLRGS